MVSHTNRPKRNGVEVWIALNAGHLHRPQLSALDDYYSSTLILSALYPITQMAASASDRIKGQYEM